MITNPTTRLKPMWYSGCTSVTCHICFLVLTLKTNSFLFRLPFNFPSQQIISKPWYCIFFGSFLKFDRPCWRSRGDICCITTWKWLQKTNMQMKLPKLISQGKKHPIWLQISRAYVQAVCSTFNILDCFFKMRLQQRVTNWKGLCTGSLLHVQYFDRSFQTRLQQSK